MMCLMRITAIKKKKHQLGFPEPQLGCLILQTQESGVNTEADALLEDSPNNL